jgi:hypothetical protein
MHHRLQAWRPRAAAGTFFRVKRLRAFLDRLPGGHRPPTGPMTTAEAADAEELRQATMAEDNERVEREQKEASDRRDREV